MIGYVLVEVVVGMMVEVNNEYDKHFPPSGYIFFFLQTIIFFVCL